jgi:polyisoprenoid-binding protein YceI
MRAFLCLFLLPSALLAAPRTYSIDGNHSVATAHVGKTGIGSFAGHEHTVIAGSLQGEVQFDHADLAGSSVDLIVVARSLTVSPQGEPEGDAPKVEERMRGPEVLDIARFATLHFRSTAVKGSQTSPNAWELRVTGEFSLHGASKTYEVPVRVELMADGSMVAEGKFSLNQTDFGIEPTSAAGGLVKVENEVSLTFKIGAKPD